MNTKTDEFTPVFDAIADARQALLRAQIAAEKAGAGGAFQDELARAVTQMEWLVREFKS